MSSVFEEQWGSLYLHIDHRQQRPVGIGCAVEGTSLMLLLWNSSEERRLSWEEEQALGSLCFLLRLPLLFHLLVSIDLPVPEWAQQELGRSAPWTSAVVEKWFPALTSVEPVWVWWSHSGKTYLFLGFDNRISSQLSACKFVVVYNKPHCLIIAQ